MSRSDTFDARQEREMPRSTAVTASLAPGVHSAIAMARIRKRMLGRGDGHAQLGRYRIIDRLGGGGMGVVYRARDPILDRDVALKVMRPDVLSKPDSFSRISREGQAIAQLVHPNVVQVFEVGVFDGSPFLAMELVRGPSLRTWLETPRTTEEILSVFHQAAEGLRAAHRAGVVHRDFKPDNVVIGAGRARVVDFGLASIDDGAATRHATGRDGRGSAPSGPRSTVTGTVMGTPAYMAPEQHLGKPATAASDQFSFCVALYEAVHGTRPFAGNTRTDVLQAIKSGKIVSGTRTRRIPSRLQRTLVRGLSFRPEERWPDMAAIADVLRPQRPKRRFVVVPLVLGIGAVVAVAPLDGASAIDCEEEAHRGPWTEDDRQTIRARFDDSGVRAADAAWHRVDAALTERSAQWTQAYLEACSLADSDPAGFDVVSTCLRRQRSSMTRLLDALGAGGPTSVLQAMRAVSSLPEPSACVADPQGIDPHPIPADDTLAERVQAVRASIDRAGHLTDLGDFDAALALADEAAEAATQIGFGPLIAEALYLQGICQHNSGDFEAAIAKYESAHHAGLQNRHDVVAAQSAIRLVDLTSQRRVDLESASRWLAAAEAVVRRFPADHPLQPMYLEATANLARAQGRYDEALEARRAAVEGYEQIHGAVSPDVATALLRLSIDCEDAGQMRERDDVLVRALDVHQKVYGGDDPNTAFVHQHMCAGALGSRAYDEVERHCRAAMRAFEAANGRKHENTVSTMFMLGQALVGQGQPDEGIPLLEEAAAFAEETYGLDDPMTGIAIGVVAQAYSNQRRYDEAEPLFWKVIERSRGSKPHARSLVMQLNNLAQMRGYQGRRADQIELLKEAATAAEDAFGPDHPLVAVPLSGLGSAIAEGGDVATARPHIQRAVAILEREPAQNEGHLGQAHCNLGDLERREGNLEAAIDAYRAAVAVLEARLGEHSATLSCPLAGWGIALAQHGQPDEARPILERVVALTNEHATFPWYLTPGLYFDPRIELADLLWQSNEDRERAAALARDGLAYCRDDPTLDQQCARVQRWLSRRGV